MTPSVHKRKCKEGLARVTQNKSPGQFRIGCNEKKCHTRPNRGTGRMRQVIRVAERVGETMMRWLGQTVEDTET